MTSDALYSNWSNRTDGGRFLRQGRRALELSGLQQRHLDPPAKALQLSVQRSVCENSGNTRQNEARRLPVRQGRTSSPFAALQVMRLEHAWLRTQETFVGPRLCTDAVATTRR
jgi:hypothetical protein